MTTKSIGLYVHIPFCVRKCAYCDFCSYPKAGVSATVRARYLDALVAEINGYKRAERISVDTVFFGGGTPSLLEPSELGMIFDAIRSAFEILPSAEITLEANPGTLTEQKLRSYKQLGANRLSIGLQSIHENELKILGRIHGYADFLESYRLARAAGFDNISVDLMYGIPEQTRESFARTLDEIISLSPEHVSAYGLIVEDGTPFFLRRDSLALPDEDAECDMYRLATEKLRVAGYSHYEISNYAKPTKESRHNLHYWQLDEYIGVGASAHSFFEGKRYYNTDSITDYKALFDDEADAEYEMPMLALRLSRGMSLAEYESRFSHSFTEGRADAIRRFTEAGLMRISDGRLSLTESGMYVSNAILSDLL